MDVSKLSSIELQDIFKSGLALRVKKEVASFDQETGEKVVQFIPLFIGEPGYLEALEAGAPKWEPLTLVKTEKIAESPESDPNPEPKKVA